VNFDVNVVAQNNGLPISYNHATNSCSLVCHGVTHTGTGSGTTIAAARETGIKR
jgi:hypothetical protein